MAPSSHRPPHRKSVPPPHRRGRGGRRRSLGKKIDDDDGGDGGGSITADTMTCVRDLKETKPTTCDDCTMQYTGWTVPNDNYMLPIINVADLTPEVFYNQYIRLRRPIVLTGMLPDLSGIEKWKDDNYLQSMLGGQSVMVERRSSTHDTFGEGMKVQMNFLRFLELMINDNDEMHYLTTQDVPTNSDGKPDLMSPLMKELKTDFPLRPKLMGNLVPQNINLWMGNAANGASSGLHHDYHDNLYIVLKGRKRFRLYSPLDAKKMYTTGELRKVHPNGRINYNGEETTAAGLDPATLVTWRKKEAEKMLEDAERAVEEGKPGAQEQLEQAEHLLNMAMDAVLDAEIHEDSDLHRHRIDDTTAKRPNNFSKVEVKYLDDKETLKVKYPEFLDANAAFCTLEAGSMLYLPASWFHEVTSYGTRDGHMAMNYWFHPPDGVDFVAPYSSDFWTNDFYERFDSKAGISEATTISQQR